MAALRNNAEFEDFDRESIYNDYENAVQNLDTKNVIIDFSSDDAFAVRNVDHAFMKKTLESKVVRNKTKKPTWSTSYHK